MKYAASERDPLALARKLEVDAVLDGHLQRNGDQVRLTVQLLRAADGAPLWAESFEEESNHLFVLQRSVSEKLAHALTLRLSAEEQRKLKQDYTANAVAYEAYTRGRYFYNKQNKESFEKALGYFRQAIESDPRYALAWVGIADCYNAMSTTIMSLGATPHQGMFAEARAAAARALELDESLAEAHVALGVALLETDHHATHRELERAAALNPNLAQAYNVYALELIGDRRFEEALSKADRARARPALAPHQHQSRGRSFPRTSLRRGRRAAAQGARTRSELRARALHLRHGAGTAAAL